MTYTPSDSEKSLATFLQVASIFLFFVPGMIIRRTRHWRSPYIRFWTKANMIWSIFTFVPFFVFLLLDILINLDAPVVVIWCIHALMTIMCSFASMFNRPLGYFMITNRYCVREMAGVYGAAVAPQAARDGDKDDG